MPRFLIEFSHSEEHEGCIKSLDSILRFGSHLVTRAEFGCEDGVHTGWLIVDVDSHDEAIQMVPPPYRSEARVVKLRNWTKEQIEQMMQQLSSQ